MKQLLLIISSLFFFAVVQAQQVGDREKYIRLYHPKNNKAHFAKMDDKIFFKIIGNKKRYKGKLELITDKGVVIDDELYPLDSLDYLISSESRINAKLTGLSVLFGGIGVGVVGAILVGKTNPGIKIAGVALIAGGVSSFIYAAKKWVMISGISRRKGWVVDLVYL